MSTLENCTLCPRMCHVNRRIQPGFCGAGAALKVARATLHFWEEPCVSGTNGSGTVFFSHCNLRCAFCQNSKISDGGFGAEITTQRLGDIFLELQAQGAHNINLVTPTPWQPYIIEALNSVRGGLHIPVAYNCGGYETIAGIKALKNYVDIFIPDLKYYSDDLAIKYSAATNYFCTALAAIKQMTTQTGAPVFDGNGILQKGVIIRHLVLPGQSKDSLRLLQALKEEIDPQTICLSLMSQYTPAHKALQMPPINRRISTYEYNKVVDFALTLGFEQGFYQDRSSAKEEYTPPFNLEGVCYPSAKTP
ncbi:MAG: radical SAM protein [Oscillospiraceae bacterium]|nr:radical SAM protein [Oscillospiraceae bacterium]